MVELQGNLLVKREVCCSLGNQATRLFFLGHWSWWFDDQMVNFDFQNQQGIGCSEASFSQDVTSWLWFDHAGRCFWLSCTGETCASRQAFRVQYMGVVVLFWDLPEGRGGVFTPATPRVGRVASKPSMIMTWLTATQKVNCWDLRTRVAFAEYVNPRNWPSE